MSDKVYLIDGSSYIFRAYYAVAHLSTSQGFPTNALFGFLRMIIKLLADADSRQVAMVFDAGRETFRTELYSQYKANRVDCPEDLKLQMPFFREFSRALGLPVFEQVGVEADDIIGTFARRFANSNIETVIVSGDKDLMQLVTPCISIWDTMRDKRYGPSEVEEKLGVPPEKVIELLGLMGDSSDNIPGVKGVGPKTALQLLELFGSIEEILKSTAEIRENKAIRGRLKIAEAIESNADMLRLSRQLVEIKTDVSLELDLAERVISLEAMSDEQLLSALVRRAPDAVSLGELAERFEFTNLLAEFKAREATVSQELTASYTTVTTENFEQFLIQLFAEELVAFDLEATSLDVLSADIVGFAFSWSAEAAWYLPVGHTGSDVAGVGQVSAAEALARLKPWFLDASKKKIGQNLKYDVSLLRRYSIEVVGVYFDTMLASYVLNPERASHSLTALAIEFLGRAPIEYASVTQGCSSFAEVAIDVATRYAAEDAHFAWLLYERLLPMLKEAELVSVFQDIEVPLLSVLSHMECTGIELDVEFLHAMSNDLQHKLEISEQRIYELAGEKFNPNSPKQLATVLFDKIGISTRGVKKTKTGFSTDSSVLEKLRYQHELPDQILVHRGLHKLKSTYVDALPQVVSKVTGRLHTRFNQTVTATGRLSSSDPNLQNIPIQSPEGKAVRKAFVAAPNKLLISADYSQIELRLLAHMSNDSAMIEAFHEDRDIHAETARDIMNIPDGEEVPSELRRIGKTINFGVVYGMSGFRLAGDLGIPVGEGNRYIEEYFRRYSGVRDYFQELEDGARDHGYVSTLFGRRRYISRTAPTGRDPGFLRRIAINAPIQGSAADLIKLAMVRIDEEIRVRELPLTMLLQIHDELVFECESNAVIECSEFVRTMMESVVSLQVPLKVELNSGPNWFEAH